MRMFHSTIAVLLGLALTVGSNAHGQSGGGGGAGGGGGGTGGGAGPGASAGGGGASVGGAGASTIGAGASVTGAGANVTGAGTNVTGAGTRIGTAANPGAATSAAGGQAFGTGRGFGAGGQMGSGANARSGANRGFGAGSSNIGTGSRFGTQQNRQGSDQFTNRSGSQNGSNESLNQGQGFSSRMQSENFDNGGQATFDQGVNNQGAFGLGNGNRPGFFDNQPFNGNQGFNQDTEPGVTNEDSSGNFLQNDDANFGSATGDSNSVNNSNFSDDGSNSFGQSSVDSGNDGTGSGLATGQPSNTDVSNFNAQLDAINRANAASAADTRFGEQGVNTSSQLQGLGQQSFNRDGVASPSDNATGAAAGRVRTGATTGDGVEDFDYDQIQRPGQFFNRPEGSSNGIGLYGPGGAGAAGRGSANFGQGTASSFQSGSTASQRNQNTAGGTAGGQRLGQFDPDQIQRPGQYFNTPQGSQQGVGLYGPGSYGFMQQYSGGSQNGASQLRTNSGTGTRQPASTQRSTNQSGAEAQREQGSQRPNYFNGNYSRSRL